MVLGFNSTDRRTIAVELRRKQSLTFPSVLDASPAAVSVALEQYGASAVPTTYVIDREGKVVAAWIGSQGSGGPVLEALGKLGIR